MMLPDIDTLLLLMIGCYAIILLPTYAIDTLILLELTPKAAAAMAIGHYYYRCG